MPDIPKTETYLLINEHPTRISPHPQAEELIAWLKINIYFISAITFLTLFGMLKYVDLFFKEFVQGDFDYVNYLGDLAFSGQFFSSVYISFLPIF